MRRGAFRRAFCDVVGDGADHAFGAVLHAGENAIVQRERFAEFRRRVASFMRPAAGPWRRRRSSPAPRGRRARQLLHFGLGGAHLARPAAFERRDVRFERRVSRSAIANSFDLARIRSLMLSWLLSSSRDGSASPKPPCSSICLPYSIDHQRAEHLLALAAAERAVGRDAVEHLAEESGR